MKIDSYAAGTPSWIDLMTTDPNSAIDFYCGLFGWQAMKTAEDMGDYTMFMKGDQPVAGIGPISDESPFPPVWSTYISVDDTDTVAAAVSDAGGSLIAPVMEVEGEGQKAGRMAIIQDPAGGVFGIWEPHDHKGSGLVNEPGSFTWNELLSRDPQASRDFLGTLFDYKWEAMEGVEEMQYYTAKVGGRNVLGVMLMPPAVPAEVPSYWNTYFAVSDTDDTVARAVAGGGTALQSAFDSPFGRMAVLADPQGASFSVVTLSEAQ